MRRLFYFLVLVTITGTVSAQPIFRVSIVPDQCGLDPCSISAARKDPATFYVVLTNQSDKPQLVWEAGNSWGYRSISFEITSSSGKTYVISKKEQRFTRNFPSTYSIPPGAQQVFPIELDDEWLGKPSHESAGTDRVTVKALFETKPSNEASTMGVGVSRISSQPYNLSLRHW